MVTYLPLLELVMLVLISMALVLILDIFILGNLPFLSPHMISVLWHPIVGLVLLMLLPWDNLLYMAHPLVELLVLLLLHHTLLLKGTPLIILSLVHNQAYFHNHRFPCFFQGKNLRINNYLELYKPWWILPILKIPTIKYLEILF